MIKLLLGLILIFAPLLRGAVMPQVFIPIYIVVLTALLLGIFKVFSSKEVIVRRTSLDIPLLFMLIVYAAAMINSRYVYGSIMELARLMILAGIFYTVINFVREEQDIKKILNLVLISAGLIALAGIMQYMGAVNKSWWDNSRFLSAAFVNHNHFAGYMELAIPLSIGMVLLERDLAKKAFYAYIFLILTTAFLLSMSRGGWLSLSISLAFMAVVIFKRGRTRLIILMTVLFLATLTIFVFNTVDLSLLFRRISSYRELDFSGRLEIWKGTLDMIKGHPFLGAGPGTFIYNFPRYRPAGLNMLINYSHNDYLQVASETGIAGLGAMVFIIWGIVKKGLNTHYTAKTPFKVWVSISIVTGILAMAIHGIGDFNFYIPSNAILFTVFSALIFNINSVKEKGIRVVVLRPAPFAYGFLKSGMALIIILSIFFMSACLAGEAYYIASEKAAAKNDLDRAELCMNRSISLCPFNYLYPYKLAGLYSKKAGISDDPVKYLKKAVSAYKKALSLNSIDSWVWIGLADAYYRLYKELPLDYGLKELAGSSYGTALELDPLNSYYLKAFAGFLLNSGNQDLSGLMYKKASEVMSRSMTLSSFSRSFIDKDKYADMAELSFRAGSIDKAAALYKMAEQFGSQDAALGQMRCYMKISNMKKAMESYRKAGYSRKNKSVLFSAIAGYCLSKGMDRTAERFSGMAIQLDPSNPEGYGLRYKIYRKKDGYGYPAEEIKKIIGFNSMALTSRVITPEAFKLAFDIKEGLCREGSICRDIVLPAGIYEISINAKGKEADDIWPHMLVRLNGMDIMDGHVDRGDWRHYSGIAVTDYPVNTLEIIYNNDYYDPETMEDRNLYIDGVELRAL